jgi:hypothetical protein
MFLDLKDADSIVNWWRVFPERHDSYLEYKLKASPEFAPAIREAQRRIAGTAELGGLLVRAGNARREMQARESSLSSRELRYQEFVQAV